MTALIRRAGLALALLLAALPLQAQVIGHIDGVFQLANGSYETRGWACEVGRAQSISVHVYAGGPAGSGTWVGATTALHASDSGVTQRCGTPGTAHRFVMPLSVAVRKQLANKKLYIHGISQTGGANSTIANSGLYGMPPTLTLTRHYVYDARQQLCKTIEPETGATLMAYDAAGNLSWTAGGLSLPSTTLCDLGAAPDVRRVARSYDARNRLIGLEFSNGIGDQIWQYTPDSLPSQIETTNQGGRLSTTVYSYNRRRLLVGEATAFGGSAWGLGYGYDAHGALATMVYPNNLSVSYAPNALGQPTRVGDYATQARYHPNGALAGFTYGNGVAWTLTQNARGLPFKEDSAGVQRYEYWYDANGNPTHLHDQTRGSSYSRVLQYDAADRLTGAGSSSFGGDHWHRFRYDALDNLNSWTHAGVKNYGQYIYDANFRLVEIRNTSGVTQLTLGYNVLGNVTQRNGRAHSFDYGNRLREVQGVEWYAYDAHGRRQLACGPNACNFHHYGQDGKLYYSNNYRTGRRENYLYLGDKQVAIREAAVGNNNQDVQVKYQHTDLLGSPVAITDAAGTVLERTHWAPYGAAIDKPAYDGIGYTGHRQDGATGLVYMQQRYYDPDIGLFLSVDPVTAYSDPAGMFNRYRYGANNPYRFVDPDGRQHRETADAFAEAGSHLAYALQSRQYRNMPSGPQRSAMARHLANMHVALYGASPASQRLRLEADTIDGAPAGIIYRRIDPKTGDTYIGRADSPERFIARQAEHNRKLGVQHIYDVVARAEPGDNLRVAEETQIRQHGGLRRDGGELVNRRVEMREGRYRAAGGREPPPLGTRIRRNR
ncbi:RHS repeat-associated core domain-containing protein [Luteimonas sp. Y-2-2-4F]|nr:RHS repeat-associated core domain-containing protein [Luteimonas sp. Y-2-2-4F]MCD9033825.1 RHS repeat-associated core domain-containing protein [Luteimonas sp. Y-2-2-4F]